MLSFMSTLVNYPASPECDAQWEGCQAECLIYSKRKIGVIILGASITKSQGLLPVANCTFSHVLPCPVCQSSRGRSRTAHLQDFGPLWLYCLDLHSMEGIRLDIFHLPLLSWKFPWWKRTSHSNAQSPLLLWIVTAVENSHVQKCSRGERSHLLGGHGMSTTVLCLSQPI